MARVLVFQHVAAEPLGTLDPLLRNRGHRIRYVNFYRNPDAKPDIGRYNALIVLGGPQMPDQGKRYPHLIEEMRCIEAALHRRCPNFCFGRKAEVRSCNTDAGSWLGTEVPAVGNNFRSWSNTRHSERHP